MVVLWKISPVMTTNYCDEDLSKHPVTPPHKGFLPKATCFHLLNHELYFKDTAFRFAFLILFSEVNLVLHKVAGNGPVKSSISFLPKIMALKAAIKC